jgi:two-component system, OmpR family, heavy metal sensor histidine kinase CusS
VNLKLHNQDKPQSLTQRTTLLFCALLTLVIALFSAYFAYASNKHFDELDRAIITDERNRLAELLRSHPNRESLQVSISQPLKHRTGMVIKIIDSNGVVLSGDTQSAEWKFSSPQQQEQWQTWRYQGKRFYGIQFRAQAADNSAIDAIIALDTVHHDHFLQSFYLSLIPFSLALATITAFLAWRVVTLGLAPLQVMRHQALQVSGSQLRPRIKSEAFPGEMAELANSLNAMLDRLEADFIRLTEFSSDLAHELRTPVSTLLTQTQVALSRSRNGPEYRDVLASNADELQRLGKIISDMLFLAKQGENQVLPSTETYSARPEVQALCEFYEPLLTDQNLSSVILGDCTLKGDRLMIRRAIANLLSNAAEHAFSGTQIALLLTQHSDYAEIAVVNTGRTIPKELLDRIFDRFVRISSSRTRDEQTSHVGLGLAIVKAIAVSHGGTAMAESDENQTVFRIKLPPVAM